MKPKQEAKLRVLMTADAVGGVWQYSVDLARGLSGFGIETALAVLGPSPGAAQLRQASGIPGLRLIDTGLPLDWLASSPACVRKAGEAVARLAKQLDVDIVQLNSPALAADAAFDRPVLAVSHSCLTTWWDVVKGEEIEGDFRWRAELTTRGLHKADMVAAPSRAFAEMTAAAHRLAEPPAVVHNGRSELPLPRVASHDFAFTAGRLWDKGKNVATLDEAARRLNVPLYAAGPCTGANGASIVLEEARALGNLGERELARWLAAKPVFVSAALYEPFGLAVLEAAAAGCPLVLSDIPTFRELWDGVAAFVDPMDAAGFAEIIGLVVGDDFARIEMGRRAKARAALFTPDAMAAKMAGLYRQLLRSESDAVSDMVAA